MQNDEVKGQREELVFFTKRRGGKQPATTRCVVFEGKLYRNKYSQRHGNRDSKSNSDIDRWICSKTNICKGEFKTEAEVFAGYQKLYTGACDKIEKEINVRRQIAIERMKQSVSMSIDPREADQIEILNNPITAEDFWDFKEVSTVLYRLRKDKGMPQLSFCKEDISKHLKGSSLEQNYVGAKIFNEPNDIDADAIQQIDDKIKKQLAKICQAQQELQALRARKHCKFGNGGLSGKLYFGCDAAATFQLFTDKEALKIMRDSEWILMDGTFKITPKISKNAKPQIPCDQVWMLHSLFKPENTIKWTMEALPCVYVLMPGKKASAEIYSTVIKFLFKEAKKVGVDLSACNWNVMSDFELAERNAVKVSLPNCNLFGCGFHYTQAYKTRRLRRSLG